VYEFLWSEFFDWYVEISKVRLRSAAGDALRGEIQGILVSVLDGTLRLLHPFMPFVTEEVWQHLRQAVEPLRAANPESLMIARWPQAGRVDEEAERAMETVMEVIRAIRNTRAEFGVEPARYVEAVAAAGESQALLQEQSALIEALARVRPLRVERELAQKPEQSATVVAGAVLVYLPLAGLVDRDAERARLSKEITSTEGEIARAEALLNKPDFVQRAPEAVVARERERVAVGLEKLAKLRDRWSSLGL
jgi:valyl-tRNA synthetase